MKRQLSAATVAALLCTVGAAALAQPRPRSPEDQAKDQYERGVKAYNLERFDDAIAAFTRAYELDPAPILLYNIAQSRWKKGENDRAVFYYRRYLEADPGAENRLAVEARIRELEAPRPAPPVAAAPVAPAPVAPPPPPPAYLQASAPPPERPPLHRRPWFWGVVAATAAATVATVVLISSGRKAASCTDCNLGMTPVTAP